MAYAVFHKDDPQILTFYQTRAVAQSVATRKNKAAGYAPFARCVSTGMTKIWSRDAATGEYCYAPYMVALDTDYYDYCVIKNQMSYAKAFPGVIINA